MVVDLLVLEYIKSSIGRVIIFWDNAGRRNEGKILGCSDEYLKFYDIHKCCERFIKLEDLREAQLK